MKESKDRSGLAAELVKQLGLVWKLMFDGRVPATTKLLLPLMAFAYTIFPIDLIPDLAPVVGQLDDLAVILIAMRLFVMLAPPDVVAEHRGERPAGNGGATADKAPRGQVIDGSYRVVDK